MLFVLPKTFKIGWNQAKNLHYLLLDFSLKLNADMKTEMILTDNIEYDNNIDSAVDQFEVHFEGVVKVESVWWETAFTPVIRSLNIHVVIKLWAGFQNLWPGRTFVLSVRTNTWKCVNRDQKRRRVQWWEYRGTLGIYCTLY